MPFVEGASPTQGRAKVNEMSKRKANQADDKRVEKQQAIRENREKKQSVGQVDYTI